jgi:Prealbumin-like fold domain
MYMTFSILVREDIATTMTTSNGQYVFSNLPAGSYRVEETNPVNYPADVSAYDVTVDGDPLDGLPSSSKNAIEVSLSPGEVDEGNIFVDDYFKVFKSPYCENLPSMTCSVCAPFRSIGKFSVPCFLFFDI